LRRREGLFRSVQVSGVGVEGCLSDNVLLKQLVLTIIVLLRQLELRICPSCCRSRLIQRGLQLIDLLFSVRERGLLLVNDELEGFWVDTEKDIAVLEGRVGLDRHFNHAPLHGGQYRGQRKIDASVGREGMIVVHSQEQQRDTENSSQRSGGKRPLVHRD